MNFMNSEVYSMMDELHLCMEALNKRKRPSLSPSLARFLHSFAKALIEVANVVVREITELWQVLVAAIHKATAVFVQTTLVPLAEACRRWRLYKLLKRVVGKGPAWWLAGHWPRRLLPRWRIA